MTVEPGRITRVAAHGLDLVQAGVRKIPKERRASVTQRAKPLYARIRRRSRVTIDRPELFVAERDVRSALEADPGNAWLWMELGRCLREQIRPKQAAEAFIRAAEVGLVSEDLVPQEEKPPVMLSLHAHARIRTLMGAPARLDRMRGIARSRAESGRTQLDIGSFFLDQGRVEEGAELVRRGYELLLDDGVLADAAVPATQSVRGPHFLIIGPPKTGTTSLYAMLADHPSVVATPRKELFFWSHRYGRTLANYDAYFPHLASGFVTGEASTDSFRVRDAAEAIADLYPHTKVILMHRDPVRRAFSQYQMARRDHREGRTFERAVDVALRRVGSSPPLRMTEVPSGPAPLLVQGCVLPFLEMWVEALGPERVVVVESAALSTQRGPTLDAVHRFLGIQPHRPAQIENRNVAGYEPMSPEIADRLRRWYAPHEEALAEYLASGAVQHVASTGVVNRP